ncbi:FAD-dependent oxidoreductase [Desulfobacterales bacterium HSG16]|nr:FAD-dependent oxidoreductase [Desulfobacterales bacterium HSG16]
MKSTKIVIVGGVAGGATAAARARRLDEQAEIVIFERGEHISFANCGLPYYIGGTIKKRDNLLVTTAEDFTNRYRIDIRSSCEVLSIHRTEKKVEFKNLLTGTTDTESYDKLILSPGAEPIRPPLPGIDSKQIFNLRNIPDTDRIKEYVDQKKPDRAVIVGGGFIGLEMVENLATKGIETIIIEKMNQVMAPLDYEMASLIHEHLWMKQVDCKLDSAVSSFKEAADKIVVTTDRGEEIECDLVILSIGVRPENTLARESGLEIGKSGGIKVDSSMKTSDPDIYAVGDAVEVMDYITQRPVVMPLAGPANKQGRIAADNALGRKTLFPGTLGTSIVKIFDLSVASTGASEKVLKSANTPYEVSYTHAASNATYYPGAVMLAFKLIFSPGSGRILGAQIVGEKGVDKRIDVIATAIRGNMTVFDLEELELAYAPPYSSAKDPVNIAGYVGANILKGDMNILNWDELENIDQNRYRLIDLREDIELKLTGTINEAIHIPLDTLRDRLSELDKDIHYLTFCAVGLRAYIAHRILVQNGFKSTNMSGGYITWTGFQETPE